MPAWLTNGAFLLGWGLGIFIIIWTLINREKPDPHVSANIKILGVTIGIKGRSGFQLFVGAILLVLPVLVANVVHAQVTPYPAQIQTVDQIPDPNHTDFVFLRDMSTLDLRGSLSQRFLKWIPFVTAGKTDPATLMNVMLIQKMHPADVISFTYATSGQIAARCLTQKCTIKRASSVDEHESGKLRETWELTANVQDIPVGQEFVIAVEVTYWNAFDSPTKQWYSTYANAQEQPENVSMLLLFPQNKPFSNYQLLSYPHGSGQGQPFEGNSRIIPGDGNLSLYWEVFAAQANDAYELHWAY